MSEPPTTVRKKDGGQTGHSPSLCLTLAISLCRQSRIVTVWMRVVEKPISYSRSFPPPLSPSPSRSSFFNIIIYRSFSRIELRIIYSVHRAYQTPISVTAWKRSQTAERLDVFNIRAKVNRGIKLRIETLRRVLCVCMCTKISDFLIRIQIWRSNGRSSSTTSLSFIWKVESEGKWHESV